MRPLFSLMLGGDIIDALAQAFERVLYGTKPSSNDRVRAFSGVVCPVLYTPSVVVSVSTNTEPFCSSVWLMLSAFVVGAVYGLRCFISL